MEVVIQADLAARNVEGSPDRALHYRIGVHLCDVRREGERLYGSGISVAHGVRVPSLARRLRSRKAIAASTAAANWNTTT